MQKTIKPFVKWVGGKTQLWNIIETLIPQEFNKYFEPFLGGGAIFLNLKPKSALISDLNSDLISTWICLRDDKKELIKNLNTKISKHSEEFYYQVRSQKSQNLSNAEIASRFIYLNKSGFNGLYRINSKGEFNVPYNKKDVVQKSTFYDEKNFSQIQKYLDDKEIQIKNINYIEALKLAKKGDFVFIDPPYDYESDNGFNSYNKNKWTKQDTENLLDALIELDQKGVKWMLTNHNTSLIKTKMAKYKSFLIPVNRFINSDPENRSLATYETIIVNYQINQEQKEKFEFELFFKSLKSSSYFLKKYVSWNEIANKISENELHISDLNFLISKSLKKFWENLKIIFDDLEKRKSLDLLPLLLAKRVDKNKKFIYLDDSKIEKEFDCNSWDSIKEFVELSGLIDNIFLNKNVSNINQYLYGVEVGLSNNDKKNKSGTFMSQSIEELLIKHKIKFKKEVKYSEVINIDLKQDKKFDFVLNVGKEQYCVEVNFFNATGSKLFSEIDRFIALSENINKFRNIKFLWVAEGRGIVSLKSKIAAIYNQNFILNLSTFEKFIVSLSRSQNYEKIQKTIKNYHNN